MAHRELVALARKYGLSDAALAELTALLESARKSWSARQTLPSGEHTAPPAFDDAAQPVSGELALAENQQAIDRYDLGDQLGVGGMGEVRRVYDNLLKRSAAMKILHADLVDPRLVRR